MANFDQYLDNDDDFDTLADQRRFVLDPETFDAFVELLDAPVEPSPKLQALFAMPNRA
jgi:uncharacterized protein (DUF1778 family)